MNGESFAFFIWMKRWPRRHKPCFLCYREWGALQGRRT